MNKNKNKNTNALKKVVALLLGVLTIGIYAGVKAKKENPVTLPTTTVSQKTDEESTKIYIVKSGDTLGSIADYFGITLDELLALNPQIENPNLIKPKDEIIVPNFNYEKIDRPSMGDEIKTNGYATGIDISYAQSGMNLKKVLYLNPNISFVIMRMAYFWKTNDKIDVNFEKQARACHEMGVPIGVYIWPTAKNDAEVEKEVRMTINELDRIKTEFGIQLELPIFLDIECEPGTSENLYERLVKKDPNAIKMLNKTIRMLEKAGYYVCIYCNSSTQQEIEQTGFNFDVGYWIADYSSNTQKMLDKVNKPVVGHQTTSKGELKGYPGHVDVNRMFLDFPSIIKENGLNGIKR